MDVKTDNSQVIDNLKCCGNCKYFEVDLFVRCTKGICNPYEPFDICEKWEWDTRTKKDRQN